MSEQSRENLKKPPAASGPAAAGDAPLQLEPDNDEEERPGYGWSWSQRMAQKLQKEHGLDVGANGEGGLPEAHANGHGIDSHETVMDENDVAIVDRRVVSEVAGCEAGHMSDMLHWALDSMHEPAIAAADWLARDIDPDQVSAAALLSNPRITLAQVKQAKSVFKTMRIVGEKSADRRVGARMYAAAIAAGLVRHGKLVTRQSDAALQRGFQGLLDDHRMPTALRDLAGMALCTLQEKRFQRDDKDEHPHTPAERPAKPKVQPQPRVNGRSKGSKR